MSVFLSVVPFRLEFTAKRSLRFAAGTAGNLFRGALGSGLRALDPELHARVFAPTGDGPSGMRQRPRPFVLRVAHLQGRSFLSGQSFYVGLHAFHPDFTSSLLETVFQQFEAAELRGCSAGAAIDLAAVAHPQQNVSVRFVTPTELVSGGEIVYEPDFATLFGRARDRVSALRLFCGAGALDLDFYGLGELASKVELRRWRGEWIQASRKSSAGELHPLGGFMGEADYEGDLQPFLPILRAAKWTGVGRHTAWGNGEISLGVSEFRHQVPT